MSALRAERERLGLTQGQIEALLWGMPHRTYQDIEAERRVPPLVQILVVVANTPESPWRADVEKGFV